ncbi:hypothetical protein PJI19_13065 [Mycobacterium kansasii]
MAGGDRRLKGISSGAAGEMWTVWEFEPRFDESITGLSLPQPPASTAITRPPDAAPSLIGLPTPMGGMPSRPSARLHRGG